MSELTDNKAYLIQALVKLEEAKKKQKECIKKIEILESDITKAIEALEFKES